MSDPFKSLAAIEHLQSTVQSKIELKMAGLSDEDIRETVEDFLLKGEQNAHTLLLTFVNIMPRDTAALVGAMYLRVYLRRLELRALEAMS